MVKPPRTRGPRLTDWPKLPLFSSVRGRIVLGFGLLILVLAIIVASSAWLHRQHLSDMAEMEEHAATSSLLETARLETTSAALILQRYVITGDETQLSEFRSSVATALDSLDQAHARLQDTGGGDEQAARLDRVLAVINPMAAGAEEIIAMQQDGDVEGATLALEEAVPAFEQFSLELQGIAERERQKVASLRTQADRTGDLAFWLLILSGVFGGALAVAVSLATARSILKPLRYLESAALAVAGGDLDARVPATGPRELARLGASLSQMTESLLDASKRRELEEALRKLSRAVEQSPTSVIITDPAGSIEYVNPKFTQLTGYTLGEVIGKNPRVLKSGETPPEEYKRLWQTITSGGEWRGEFHNKKKNGELYWESASISPIRGADGAINHFLGVKEDITERKRAEQALRESESRHRTLLENLPQRIFLKDRDSVYVSCNENYARDLDIRPDDIAGKTDYDFFPKELADKYRADDKRVTDSGETEDIEEDYVQDGQRVYVQTVKTPVRDENGDAVGVLGIFWDISERKQAEQALRRANQQLAKDRREIEALNRSLEANVRERTRELRLANVELQKRNRQLLDARAQAATDALTGLWNHRAFHERIREEVRLAQDRGSPLGVIMMDVDDFKRINDSLGHQAGDDVLRTLALTIAHIAQLEQAYRYGGDEFAVLLPGADGRKTAQVAERLRRAAMREVNGSGNKITVSLGLASFPGTAASAEELIYGADAAMYWAKSAGKNRVGDWSRLLGQREEGTLPWYAADHAVKAPEVVAALVAALAAKDPATAGHTERCSWYAAKLAEQLGLPEEETSIVRLASLLHDIGKLAVRDEVLFKAGPLDEEEWAQMKQHPTAALHVLSHIRSITGATPAILHHHEHFEGSGYPDGLAGEQIPIASRILLVTDAFDAMTTDRPYRKAMPVEAAVEELKRHSGSQFDPTVVDAFLRVLARHGAQPLDRMVAVPKRPAVATSPSSGRRER